MKLIKMDKTPNYDTFDYINGAFKYLSNLNKLVMKNVEIFSPGMLYSNKVNIHLV